MGRKYDREFKIEAVKLALSPGNKQSLIERELGIGQGIISKWKKELSKDVTLPKKVDSVKSKLLL